MTSDGETDDDLSLDPTLRNNTTVDNTIDENRRATKHMSTSKEDSSTTMLESTMVDDIPPDHEYHSLLIFRRGLDLRIAETQSMFSLCKEKY